MANYKKKSDIFKAVIYKKGMEDGFNCVPFQSVCQWKNKQDLYRQCDECKMDIYKKPFLNTPDGSCYINDGDYIVTEKSGDRYSWNPDDFNTIFEMVDNVS